MHCATGRGRLQSWANKDEDFASLCTGLRESPNGMGELYDKLVSKRFGPEYIDNETFRKQLAVCHTHNTRLTAALIETEEGAQVVLETRNGIPGSTFAAIEEDIRRRSDSVQYSYLTALASHASGNRAKTQIQAVIDAGGNAAELTFRDVRRQDARSTEAGTFFCGFEGCPKSYADLKGLKKHVTQQQTAKPPTHVGYTPNKADFSAEIEARGTRDHRKKTWNSPS